MDRTAGRAISRRDLLKAGGAIVVSFAFPLSARDVLAGAAEMGPRIRGRHDGLDREVREAPLRLVATAEYCERLPRTSGLRIAILVWTFEVYGGVLALADLANRLVLDGHSVWLVTLSG